MIDIKANINDNKHGYYIFLSSADKGYTDSDKNIAASDKNIAAYLQLELNDYQKHLVNNYNAYLIKGKEYNELYFMLKEDADKAIEWIDSIILSIQLTK